ncbi:MAG: class I SAM-dependent methyltransferase [Deltaproteobacteria bacterium]|nr:class I SAM-dependent methyltransferase [Deltaproteobacteria bacterium]
MRGAPELERVACPLCEGRDEAPFRIKDGFAIVRCRGCGLVYVNPRLPIGDLERLYGEQVISPAAYYVRTEAQDERSFAERISLIERWRPPGRLLDLGCGPGTFSAAARARGWTTLGLEINATSVAHCRSRGLDVIGGAFPHPALRGETFDAVAMNDFLEHLADPLGALRTVRSLLAPDGVVFISTPDVGAAMARLTGVRWLHLKPNEHLVYFDRRTIRRALDAAGFRVVHVRSIGRVRNLGVALEKVAAYGELPSRAARMLVPRALADRVNLPINPGDEMAVLAVPRGGDRGGRP